MCGIARRGGACRAAPEIIRVLQYVYVSVLCAWSGPLSDVCGPVRSRPVVCARGRPGVTWCAHSPQCVTVTREVNEGVGYEKSIER